MRCRKEEACFSGMAGADIAATHRLSEGAIYVYTCCPCGEYRDAASKERGVGDASWELQNAMRLLLLLMMMMMREAWCVRYGRCAGKRAHSLQGFH